MQIREFITSTTRRLEDVSVPTARLDTLVLLADAFGKDKSWILANQEVEISENILEQLDRQIKQRSEHIPLAYIRGKSEFFGREFLVSPDTLQPRSETETMIELLKKLSLTRPVIADIGTGSGCLAITAGLENSSARVFATDISKAALIIAETNARHHNAPISFHHGNLLEPVFEHNPSVLLCNLPYVPNAHTINRAAMQEPEIAIFGGEDGLDLYRMLFSQIDTCSKKPDYILTESLPFQHSSLAELASQHQYSQVDDEDFIQVFNLDN